jgi:hypothetical protein
VSFSKEAKHSTKKGRINEKTTTQDHGVQCRMHDHWGTGAKFIKWLLREQQQRVFN